MGSAKKWGYGMVALGVVLVGAFVATPAAATVPVGPSGLSAAIDCGSRPVNHRRFAGVHINLWFCYGIPNSHGPMYHAQIANATSEDAAVLRYRTTMNNAVLSKVWPQGGETWANTADYYAAPNEVQACADIKLLGGAIERVCAWTADDGGS